MSFIYNPISISNIFFHVDIDILYGNTIASGLK
jgi:hypothetical protein